MADSGPLDAAAPAPQYVHQLQDGRFFITDLTVAETPGLGRLIDRMSNYWTRHEWLDGWVAPRPDDHG